MGVQSMIDKIGPLIDQNATQYQSQAAELQVVAKFETAKNENYNTADLEIVYQNIEE